jgi:hypothetical protein
MCPKNFLSSFSESVCVSVERNIHNGFSQDGGDGNSKVQPIVLTHTDGHGGQILGHLVHGRWLRCPGPFCMALLMRRTGDRPSHRHKGAGLQRRRLQLLTMVLTYTDYSS